MKATEFLKKMETDEEFRKVKTPQDREREEAENNKAVSDLLEKFPPRNPRIRRG
jgi:hypothetical protein